MRFKMFIVGLVYLSLCSVNAWQIFPLQGAVVSTAFPQTRILNRVPEVTTSDPSLVLITPRPEKPLPVLVHPSPVPIQVIENNQAPSVILLPPYHPSEILLQPEQQLLPPKETFPLLNQPNYNVNPTTQWTFTGISPTADSVYYQPSSASNFDYNHPSTSYDSDNNLPSSNIDYNKPTSSQSNYNRPSTVGSTSLNKPPSGSYFDRPSTETSTLNNPSDYNEQIVHSSSFDYNHPTVSSNLNKPPNSVDYNRPSYSGPSNKPSNSNYNNPQPTNDFDKPSLESSNYQLPSTSSPTVDTNFNFNRPHYTFSNNNEPSVPSSNSNYYQPTIGSSGPNYNHPQENVDFTYESRSNINIKETSTEGLPAISKPSSGIKYNEPTTIVSVTKNDRPQDSSESSTVTLSVLNKPITSIDDNKSTISSLAVSGDHSENNSESSQKVASSPTFNLEGSVETPNLNSRTANFDKPSSLVISSHSDEQSTSELIKSSSLNTTSSEILSNINKPTESSFNKQTTYKTAIKSNNPFVADTLRSNYYVQSTTPVNKPPTESLLNQINPVLPWSSPKPAFEVKNLPGSNWNYNAPWNLQYNLPSFKVGQPVAPVLLQPAVTLLPPNEYSLTIEQTDVDVTIPWDQVVLPVTPFPADQHF